jgi:hypothetical protein
MKTNSFRPFAVLVIIAALFATSCASIDGAAKSSKKQVKAQKTVQTHL